MLHGRNETETVSWSWSMHSGILRKSRGAVGQQLFGDVIKATTSADSWDWWLLWDSPSSWGRFLLLKPSPVHLDTLKALRPRLMNAATAFLFPCLDHRKVKHISLCPQKDVNMASYASCHRQGTALNTAPTEHCQNSHKTLVHAVACHPSSLRQTTIT